MKNSFFNQQIVSENQQIHLSVLREKGVELWMKREDLIHPEISGNKFRKLKYNLFEAKKQNQSKVLTFGGAFSNHILATAVAAKQEGLESIGVIRGEELSVNLSKTLQENSTLNKAAAYGMEFHFVARSDYREKSQPEFIKTLHNKFEDFFLIPEGGTNLLAVKGCEEILTEQDDQFTYICSCVGTGGTVSGLINAIGSHQKVLGFPALRGDFLKDEIEKFSIANKSWKLMKDYHFGGYAKYSKELIQLINQFKEKTSIQLDPIYTGKMMFGILDLVGKDFFEKGSKILAIHTGGLQGIEGFNQKLKKKNSGLQIYL